MKAVTRSLLPAALAVLLAGPAGAAIVITASEVGPNVVFTYSGSLNISSATFVQDLTLAASVNPALSTIQFAPPTVGTSADMYSGLTGPANFGTITFAVADSSSGDPFSITMGSSQAFGVPDAYVNNSPLSGTMTFNAATLASLNIVPGTYQWSVPSGDTITLNAVPEPSGALLAGLGAIGLVLRRRRRA